jgi:hypothetical protein
MLKLKTPGSVLTNLQTPLSSSSSLALSHASLGSRFSSMFKLKTLGSLLTNLHTPSSFNSSLVLSLLVDGNGGGDGDGDDDCRC